jgi:hypothetical protein
MTAAEALNASRREDGMGAAGLIDFYSIRFSSLINAYCCSSSEP